MYKEMLKRNEGVRNKVYKDSLGIPTIGVGLNLRRLDSRERLAAVGAAYDDILVGKAILTDAQIDTLLAEDIDDCVKDLKALLPKFDAYPPEARAVLVDLRFNLGGKGLRGFNHTLDEFRAGRFSAAGDRLKKSVWFLQVGRRAKENVAILKAIPDLQV